MADLEDLYREIILDHYRSPRNRGELDSPPATRAEGFNPLCGDEIVVYLQLADPSGAELPEDRVVEAIRIGGQGCSISQASASMMSSAVTGRTVSEVRTLMRSFKAMMSIHEHTLDGDDPEAPAEANAEYTTADDIEAVLDADAEKGLGDLAALRGVVKFPVRIKCATLSWNTLDQALSDSAALTGD
ncbi:MAG: SUF system NifU family Fe-S cluster assembly protein [Microthrixaceae bacterium]